MSKNVILLGLDPYSGNRGVGALAYSTMYLLEQWAIERGYELNLYFAMPNLGKLKVLNLKVGDKEIQITEFPLCLDKGFNGFVKKMLSLFISRKIISSSNYVLDMGQGDSFSDIYGEARFNLINDPKRLFRKLNKKQLILPQTIGPFNDSKVFKEAKKSIEKSQLVLVRDRQSYEYVIENTEQKNIFELIDVAFYMPFMRTTMSNVKLNVGLNVSSLMWHGGYTKNNQFNFNFDYQKITRRIIDYFLLMPNVKLHLIPHVVGSHSSIENDYEISRKLQEEYGVDNLLVSPFFLDPIDAKSYISALDFFTGARMHACIAAFSSGVPVYPIAYSRKFNGLFMDTLQYPYLGDLINQTEEEFINGLKKAFIYRNELKVNIQNSITNIIKPTKKLFFDKLDLFFGS